MSLPTLETARLVIREYTLEDLYSYHRLIKESFERDDTLDDALTWLEWTTRNYRTLEKLHQPPYGDYAVTLKTTGEVIGAVGLVLSIIAWGAFDTPADPQRLTSPEFGLFWAVLPEHWGKGYAPEAARVFVDALFHLLNPRRLVATTEHDNLKSQRVMEKLGMRLYHNPTKHPFWLQVVGVLENPLIRPADG
jgi:RimJ/RimL family protein N-acetyltransferase